MSYRPLSTRGKKNTDFDSLHEGIPPWLAEPVCWWLRPYICTYDEDGGVKFDLRWMRLLQVRMRLDPPLPWGGNPKNIASALEERVTAGTGEVGLDIVDYTLSHLAEFDPDGADDKAQAIASNLLAGGSAWEVVRVDDRPRYALTRRALGPVREAIEELPSDAQRASSHLGEAWRYLAGRDPVPDQAYFQALMAAEAAAKPVVSPRDSAATLGKMLRAIKDAPQNFRFSLGDPRAVIPVMDAMWATHVRHGTDDRAAPMGMSQQEADAAVHLALTLVRWFAGGHITRT